MTKTIKQQSEYCHSTEEIGKQENPSKDPDHVKNLLTLAESRSASGETKKFKIRNINKFAVIDAEDYERVAGFDWRGYVQNYNRTVIYYNSAANGTTRKIYLARMILNLEETNARIVYRNGNTLDLRKENLKIKINIGTPRPSLFFHKNTWRLQLILNGKGASIGSYQTKAEAEAVIASIPAEILQNSSYKNADEFRKAVKNWKTLVKQSKENFNRPILQNGQLVVKTGDKYVSWARIVWENSYGKIPDDNFIIFKDGNKLNCDLKNLKRVDRRNMNRLVKLYQYPPQVRETVLTVWKLKKIIVDPKLRKNYQPKQRQPGEVKIQNNSLVRADGSRFWTDEEDAKLKALYRTQSCAELGKVFKRSPKAVVQHAMSLGITSSEPVKFWTTEKLALLKEIYPMTDSEECAARFGCTVHAVYAQTKKMGIRKDSEFVRKTHSEIQKKLYSPATFKPKKLVSEVNYAQ